MGPLRFIRLARMARRPPSKERVIIFLAVVGLAIVVIGGERLFGLEFKERDMNWRNGPKIQVSE